LRAALRIELSCLALLLVSTALAAQDQIASLRAQFAKETNPVHKAKLMPRLGDAAFRQITDAFKAGRLEDAEAELALYEVEAQECTRGLDEAHIDADKHPAGFKQLEISVREALRRLDPLIASLDAAEQVPFLFRRKQLAEMLDHLNHELFPRGPDGKVPVHAPVPAKQNP
jgi:hypothetical protein